MSELRPFWQHPSDRRQPPSQVVVFESCVTVPVTAREFESRRYTIARRHRVATQSRLRRASNGLIGSTTNHGV
jgi:hypothetical protein